MILGITSILNEGHPTFNNDYALGVIANKAVDDQYTSEGASLTIMALICSPVVSFALALLTYIPRKLYVARKLKGSENA
jgi:hypothetical protein